MKVGIDAVHKFGWKYVFQYVASLEKKKYFKLATKQAEIPEMCVTLLCLWQLYWLGSKPQGVFLLEVHVTKLKIEIGILDH